MREVKACSQPVPGGRTCGGMDNRHQGDVTDDAAVTDGNCGIAFAAAPGKHAPQLDNEWWTSRDGLLLETRRFKQCNLNSLDAVRKSFDSASPIGAEPRMQTAWERSIAATAVTAA